MARLPKTPQKIQERIKRIEQALKLERRKYGGYDDSAGNRYWLGPLYLLAGDLPGAVKSFRWFDKTFADDMGEPFHYLCWTLALYRSGDLDAAAQKLRQTMLKNLYLLPHLFGIQQEPLPIWHWSNLAEASYMQWVPPELFALWDGEARRWAQTHYESQAFTQIRTRYIEINQELKNERDVPRRKQLVEEARTLEQ